VTEASTTTSANVVLPRSLLLTLAAAIGVTVANMYYAQPLLHTIADRFGASVSEAGLIVTASQLGYAAGLALLVPAGDLLDRRRLAPRLLIGAAALLVVAALAPSLWVLIAVMAMVGSCVVVAQILVPLVAELATDGQRGRAVGTVMSGLLLGILLARTYAGAVGELAGWRTVFGSGAALTLAFAVVLRRRLPPERHRPSVSYREIMRTTVQLARSEPELRRSAVLGGLLFGAFSIFWTTIAFVLAEAPFDYGDSAIGLLGLIGAAGALCATISGRLADRGHAYVGRIGASVCLGSSFAILWFGRHSILMIIVGVIVLDIGTQGGHILNQSVVYELAHGARSRINGVYMTSYFVGGALGSFAGSVVYDHRGWGAVCVLGGAVGVVAVAEAARAPHRVRRNSPETLAP
jgi:predicted MFS family arabinose efflux permease